MKWEIECQREHTVLCYVRIFQRKKISNGAKAMKYINTNKSVKTYFRGIYKSKKGKFEPYNDKYFKDLYFEIE